ncbi:pre-mRNA-splicing factor rse-1 [Fusarium agapanthi]|uniref:Pre-mRNA-splicing factor rse-1 n=1 Tax=Fusarium agapanthi TaxID=1803897 RepID=A0A9P5B5J2_9HYPO|nr:pre-mRNA-splicing factor rse-1 [Fusarium agapanthi]
MAARVLEASTAREMGQRVCSGVNLDDLIFNIELLKPPTQSEPWEADVADKPGYHHFYALLGCLMATSYARQCFTIETLYLNRAISNLDVVVLKMPNNPFKEFRRYLEKVRKEVHRLQVFFQRIEIEDGPATDSVLCAIYLELKPIIGFHDTEYPYHKMDFEWVYKGAVLRCRNGALKIDLIAHYCGAEQPSYDSYELYCSPGTPPPWKIIGTGTHVQHDVTSPGTWDMIRGWIGQCINHHKDCKVVSEDRPFPTRVVAVGDGDREPHLFIPSSDDRGRYIALSHCWGDAMPLKTTNASFTEFCHGLHFDRFPKTFQDAITVCRKLSIEYLWIDSLCIIQGHEHNWAIESPKVCDIYQNAYLTIAAAAAHNSSEGLFQPRPFSLRKSFLTASKNGQLVDEVLQKIELEGNEAAMSAAVVPFTGQDGESFLLVGTGKDMILNPRQFSEGYIHVYRFQENGRELEFIHKTKVEEPPMALVAFQGRLAAGIGKALRIYDLGLKQLLRKSHVEVAPQLIVSLNTQGIRLVVGDLQQGVTMVVFDHEYQKLIPFIDDTIARWTTCTAMVDYESVAGGDKFGNLWIVRYPEKASQEADEGGNPLLNARDYLHGAPNRLDSVAHYFAQDIPTSITKASLVVGGQDVIVWSGLQGTIGVLIPFVTREDADFFHTLEVQMRAEDQSPVGRDYLMYRGYYVPVKGVIDGELCERFRLLPLDKKQQIAGELDRSVRGIERKISDVRTRSAF